ncbi:hypothetical protein [Salinibacter ruber]|uniref:hypothetical protein n=1 Tax=Salinibacter ruber TaxID=146919 RepID=UPI0021676BD1|nr:hypothetical protein [Salinibacter ruber]MCS3695496.1 hypothetical protein [Salinibacter ruber]
MRDEEDENLKIYQRVGAEALFAIFPLVVVAIVFSYEGRFLDLLKTPEWSFAAAVLSGQSLVKLLSGSANLKEEANYIFIGLVGSFLFVFVLGPSIVTLTYIILSKDISLWIGISQVAIFLMSISALFIVGGHGQRWIDKGEI